jgi:hypothetical protein
MHQSLQGATFHIEHITPQSVGGTDDESNLAVACPSCNLAKSNRTSAVDPDTSQPAALFHPRTDRWADHFRWDGHSVVGLTPTGRATADALGMNAPRRLLIRQAEQGFNLFPPGDI